MQLTPEQKQLAADNLKLIPAYFWKYKIPRQMEPDEAYAIARLTLVIAAKTYRNHLGAFSTYVFRCIRNNIATVTTAMNAEKRTPRNRTVLNGLSLDECLPAKQCDPLEHIDYCELRHDIFDLLGHLNEKSRLAVSLRFGLHDGISREFRVIAKEFGVSTAAVQQRIQKALALLRMLAKSKQSLLERMYP